jgi:hypothetical protein
MINGFIIEVLNNNNNEVTVPFFIEETQPTGISVNSKNAGYKYASLLIMAQMQGFAGSGFITDDKRVSHLTICKNNQHTQHDFFKILDNQGIIIDGKDNYISLNFPPMSTTLVQLMPIVV